MRMAMQKKKGSKQAVPLFLTSLIIMLECQRPNYEERLLATHHLSPAWGWGVNLMR